jgi:hypothetical protein
MNSELNGLDDDLFAPISEEERAHLIGGAKTVQMTSTTSTAISFAPGPTDVQVDADFDRNKDQTGVN